MRRAMVVGAVGAVVAAAVLAGGLYISGGAQSAPPRPAGPIPDGVYLGGAFFPQGEGDYSRIGEVVGGILGRGVPAISHRIERVATYVWKGKAFDRDHMVLRNLIEDRTTLEAIIDDEDIETIEIPRTGFFSIFAPTRTVWL